MFEWQVWFTKVARSVWVWRDLPPVKTAKWLQIESSFSAPFINNSGVRLSPAGQRRNLKLGTLKKDCHLLFPTWVLYFTHGSGDLSLWAVWIKLQGTGLGRILSFIPDLEATQHHRGDPTKGKLGLSSVPFERLTLPYRVHWIYEGIAHVLWKIKAGQTVGEFKLMQLTHPTHTRNQFNPWASVD